MEALSVLGFVGTILTLADFAIRTGHHTEIIRLEFKQQQSEYDVIRLTLQEAVKMVVSDGAPTEAIQASMLLCAKLDKDVEREFSRVEHLLRKRGGGHRRALELVQVFSRRNERRYAYEAFRDAALLLRDLSYSMQQNRQMSGMRSDIADIHGDSAGEDSESVEDWDPIEYKERTGVNLEDITKSKLKSPPERPLIKTLAGSNYTFGCTITGVRDTNVRYTPIRGLWDTGSDAFMIRKEITERAGIREEELERLDSAPTVHGVNGAIFKPTLCVTLTWYVNRNMNSRQDTFYVIDEADFDVLVPYTLTIGIRSTGYGKEGQNALILRLFREKKEAESREEKKVEKETIESTSLRKKAQQEEKSKKRQEEIEAREKQLTVNNTASNP